MNFLVGLYQKIGSKMIAMSSVLPSKISNIFIVSVNTLFLFMSPMAVHGMDGLGRWKYYSKWGIVFMLLIVLLLFRYKEQETKKKLRVSYLLVIGIFLGSMLVSEQLVPKVRPVYQGMSWCYLAYIMLGILIGRSKQMIEHYFRCFMCSVEISFVFVTMACFLFRPVVEGVRYFGIYPNANSFAIYLTLVVAASVWFLNHEFIEPHQRSFRMFCTTEIVLAIFFIIKTGSRAALLNVMLILIIWFAFMLIKKEDPSEKRKRIVKMGTWGITIVMAVALSYPLMDRLLYTLPDIVAHPIYSEMDPANYQKKMKKKYGMEASLQQDIKREDTRHLEEYKMVKMGLSDDSWIDDVFGEESALMRLFASFKEKGIKGILGPRAWIFRYGIDHMDWYGHENGTFTAEGHDTQPHMHNGYIQNGYVYGYVCMFANICMNILIAIYLFSLKNKCSESMFAPILLYTVFFVVYMFEGGGTVVRDVLIVPYMLLTGMLVWKEI